MRIKRFLGALALFVAVLTVGSSAWALSYADHVSLAPNGQGDVLIFPIYVATDGWESNISVINTSNQSVVAKIVFRSYAYSQELMDFLLYLSPNDMWVGTVKKGVVGRDGKVGVGVYSVDSSALYDSGMDPATIPDPFARDETDKRLQKLFVTPCSNAAVTDLNTLGYITVTEAWAGTVPFTAEQEADKQKRGKAISAWYLSRTVPLTTIGALSGSIDINFPGGGATATSAVALKNWKNERRLSAGTTNALGMDIAGSNMLEMEAALSRGAISVPFNNQSNVETWHFFTFPTKGTDVTKTTPCVASSNGNSTYFKFATVATIAALDEYDIDEVHALNPFSPAKALILPFEAHYIPTKDAVFTQGWMRYQLADRTTTLADLNKGLQPLSYNGAPVIPIVIDFINEGSVQKMTIKSASYTDSIVYGGPTGSLPTIPMPGYQYSSRYVPT